MVKDLFLIGDVGEMPNADGYFFTLAKVSEALKELQQGDELNVFINSGGGYLDVADAIYELLKKSNVKVNTIGYGTVGSAATKLLQANANGGKRYLTKEAKFIAHNPLRMFDGGTMLNADAMEAHADDLRAEERKLRKFYSGVSNLSDNELKFYLNREHEFSGEEAVKSGFADEIYTGNIKGEARQYKLAAYLNIENFSNNKTKIEMDKIEKIESNLGELGKSVAKLLGFAKGQAKLVNKLYKTADGIDVWTEGEKDLAVGTQVYIDEMATEKAQDGTFTIDGNLVTILDGIVTEIVPTSDSTQIASLKATIQSKDAEIASLKATIADTDTKVATLETSIAEKVKEVDELVAKFTSGGAEPKTVAKVEKDTKKDEKKPFVTQFNY